MQMRGPKTEGGIERRRYEMRITVLKSDENGKPQTLLGVQRDITHEKQKREREREELLTYQNVFDSALLDMVFYDENGILSDINDAACKTFQIADKQVLINSQTHLRDVTYYDDVDISNLEMTRSTSVIDLVEMEKEGRKAVSVESDERL
jgi:PAS domain-containing protein